MFQLIGQGFGIYVELGKAIASSKPFKGRVMVGS